MWYPIKGVQTHRGTQQQSRGQYTHRTQTCRATNTDRYNYEVHCLFAAPPSHTVPSPTNDITPAGSDGVIRCLWGGVWTSVDGAIRSEEWQSTQLKLQYNTLNISLLEIRYCLVYMCEL